MPQQTQQAVNYRRGYPLQCCGDCTMYGKPLDPNKMFGACSAVTGQITAYGVCDLFYRLRNPFGFFLPWQYVNEINRLYNEGRQAGGAQDGATHEPDTTPAGTPTG